MAVRQGGYHQHFSTSNQMKLISSNQSRWSKHHWLLRVCRSVRFAELCNLLFVHFKLKRVIYTIYIFFYCSIFGYLAEKLGKKISLILVAFPNIVNSYHLMHFYMINKTFLQLFWILVFFATDVVHLYIARVFAGLTTGGVLVVVPLFIADISENQ